MKTVANCSSLQEANLVRMRLNAAGIECFIPDENSAGVAPFHLATRAGVRVQVADEDEARAVDALGK